MEMVASLLMIGNVKEGCCKIDWGTSYTDTQQRLI